MTQFVPNSYPDFDTDSSGMHVAFRDRGGSHHGLVTYQTSPGGGIVTLAGVSGAAPMNIEIGGRRIHLAGAPRSRQAFVWFDPTTGGSLNAVPQANCTIISQGWETYKGEQCYRVTATATDVTANAFELLLPTLSDGFSATSIQIEMAFEDCTKFVGVYPFFTTAASNGTYSTYMTGSYGGLSGPITALAPVKNGMSHYNVCGDMLNKTGVTTGNLGDYPWKGGKIRCAVQNGQTGTIWFRSVTGGGLGGKARIAIRSDDGYSSFVHIGQKILDEYGLRSSLAVIPERVGQPGFVTESDLQMYVAAGNECVPHGPNRPGYLNGSLFDAWPTNPERAADIFNVIKWLDDRGLITENGKRLYVWPTGRYLESLSDDSLLYALMDLGITTGFGTTENAFQKFRTDLISSSNPYRMALNCVGHTWSSTDEAVNVTNVIARIQAAVDARADCHLKLHKVVGVDAASSTIEISTNRLRQIAAAIRAQIDAGNAENVLLSDLAAQ
jgi:hypothetical protein